MIQDAMKYIKELVQQAEPVEMIEKFGQHYYVRRDGQLSRIEPDENSKPSRLDFNTLTGLTDYINANIDKHDLKNAVLVVNNPRNVTLETAINPIYKNERAVLARTRCPECEYVFGDPRGEGPRPWYEVLDFVIALQSQFVQANDVNDIISHMSNLANSKVVDQKDDGFAQHINVKTGITTHGEVKIENPVNLAPHRTFREIDQPVGDFVLRLQEKKDREGKATGVECALFAADGGKWELEAMDSIRAFLKTSIQTTNEIPILC